MFENKMRELEKELALKTASVSKLQRQLKETDEVEEIAERRIGQLEEQVRAGNAVLARWNILEKMPLESTGGNCTSCMYVIYTYTHIINVCDTHRNTKPPCDSNSSH